MTVKKYSKNHSLKRPKIGQGTHVYKIHQHCGCDDHISSNANSCAQKQDDDLPHHHNVKCGCSTDQEYFSSKTECACTSTNVYKKEHSYQNTLPDNNIQPNNNNITTEILLEGLHCSNCAAKMEKNINALQEVEDARLNFATSTLFIKTSPTNQKIALQKASDIILQTEDGVNIKVQNSTKPLNFENTSSKNKNVKLLIKLGISVVFLLGGIFLRKDTWSFVSFIISYLIIGFHVIKKSFINIKKGELFDENFLMTIATFGAIWVGEYPEAVMVMLLYEIGEYFQERAVESSRKSITNLMDIRPDYSNLKVGNQIKKVSPSQVKVGDIIVVKPGEKVPLDGIVIEGFSSVDTKALTGESLPQQITVGNDITSGFINIDGLLTIKVVREFKESAVSKILDLVQNASAKKAKTELRITKFAKYYTPIVVLIALLISFIPPLLFSGQFLNDWLIKGATFLVVSCPCALVISIPMSYFAGLGASSREGVLVKGGNYLEALSKTGILVFDKTGTLTEGKFKVSDIINEPSISKENLLKFTAYVESFSTHPIATSIVDEYGKKIKKEKIKNYKETKGKGVEAEIDGIKIVSGNINFLKEKNIKVNESKCDGSIIYTAINNKYCGCLIIKDSIKKDSKRAIEGFNELGINNIVMLTGDRKITADITAKDLGIKNYKYELLPADKVAEVEQIIETKATKSLVFVGDGINDAPVLARADVGVAMGGIGSDAAIEAADVVIMNDEPSKLINAIKIAQKTKNIVNQNIFFALSVKLCVMILAFFGLTPMWLAIFADVGVSILAVLNAMRILKK